MAFAAAINFRATSAYVTDGAGQTYSLGEAYPTTRAGLTFGWGAGDSANARNRVTTNDPRLCGMLFASTSGSVVRTFRLDLPAPGQYDIRLAMGDASVTFAQHNVAILDGSTPLLTISTGQSNTNSFYDAAYQPGDTNWSAAAWPGSNRSVRLTFAGTVLTCTIGKTGTSGQDSELAHLSVTQVSGGSFSAFPVAAARGSGVGSPASSFAPPGVAASRGTAAAIPSAAFARATAAAARGTGIGAPAAAYSSVVVAAARGTGIGSPSVASSAVAVAAARGSGTGGSTALLATTAIVVAAATASADSPASLAFEMAGVGAVVLASRNRSAATVVATASPRLYEAIYRRTMGTPDLAGALVGGLHEGVADPKTPLPYATLLLIATLPAYNTGPGRTEALVYQASFAAPLAKAAEGIADTWKATFSPPALAAAPLLIDGGYVQSAYTRATYHAPDDSQAPGGARRHREVVETVFLVGRN